MNTTPGAPTDAQIDDIRNIRSHPSTMAWGAEVRRILSLHPAPSAALAAPVASPEPVADVQAFLDLAAQYCSTASNGDWTFAQGDIKNFAAEVVAKHHAGRAKAVHAALAAPIAPSPPTTPPAAEPGAWLVTGTYIYQPFTAKSSAEAYVKGLLTTDPEGGYKISPLYAAPSTAQGLSDAEQVLAAMDGGEWSVERCDPAPFLTDEFNAANAWMVKRKSAPYCDAKGMRQWAGATALEALNKAKAAIFAANKGETK